MKSVGFLFILFSLTAFSQDSSRVDELNQQKEIILKRIKEGSPKSLLQEQLNSIEAELATLTKAKAAPAPAPKPAAPAKKAVKKKKAVRKKYVNNNSLKNDIDMIKGQIRDLTRSKKGGSKFAFKGHFQARTESARNRQGVQGTNQTGQTFSRLRLDSSFHPNDKLSFFLSPQATKVWGGVQGSVNSSGTAGTQTTSGGTTQPDLTFFKAYIEYELMDGLKTMLGRQELAYGDHLVIGSLPWANTGRSFDAIRFRYDISDMGWVDAYWSKLSDNANNGTALQDTDDKDLYSIYSSIKKTAYLNPLDLYYLRQVDRTSAAQTTINHFGIRIKGAAGNLFYRTENGIQAGSNHGDDAFSLDFETGYKINKHKVSVQYGSSGKNYFQFYPTAHKFLGFVDVLGRRNVDHMAAHYKGSLTDSLKLALSYHKFNRNDSAATATKLTGGAWGTNGTSDDIGQEVDLVANIVSKNKIKLQLGACLFMPGQYLKDQDASLRDDDVKFFYAQVNAGF